jgi:ketol-acid reductoisomerase
MTTPTPTTGAHKVTTRKLDFQTDVFDKQYINLNDTREGIVVGGRHLFERLPRAFEGVNQIGVIGWGPQASAQAQNLRDSLAGSDLKVVVGLREGSASFDAARAAGFSEADGTLGEMFEVIRACDMVLLLIADAAQAERHEQIFAALRPGATLGLSHGFLLGYLDQQASGFPEGIDVIAVCPKGMGASVRALYQQGTQTIGAGINASFAVEQDHSGRAVERALGWSVALGAPYTFQTTLRSEYLSDLTGERSILLGGVHGIVESLYRRFRDHGLRATEAYRRSVDCVTGPISRTVSKEGLIGLYDKLDADDQETFGHAYTAAYPVGLELTHEIYDEVASGNEIRSVILAGERLARFPMGDIDRADMWRAGEVARRGRIDDDLPLDAFTAGTFCGVMMGQIDTLIEKGHPYSEIANESVIEATDSLNPYMHARGVSYMVDNCSTTARLGARKWAPRFDYLLTQTAYPAVDHRPDTIDTTLIKAFEVHPIHDVLRICAEMRPPVDIFVS